ncbi:MAG: MerR family transcriptional regulator [Pseudomonadota bacterium]
MEKSPEAFRTISEVADWLGVPTHVLRFWESRFTQIKPVKRAGGRRYYRPSDMALIGGIKRLLHDDGMTIRGAQKLLREKGIKHVAALSQPLDGTAPIMAGDVIEGEAQEVAAPESTVDPPTPEPADTAAVEEPQPDQIDDAEELDPAPPSPKAIPPTPDVPDTDPDDADTAFPADPGFAARLLVANAGYLARNRDALRVARNRLGAQANT